MTMIQHFSKCFCGEKLLGQLRLTFSFVQSKIYFKSETKIETRMTQRFLVRKTFRSIKIVSIRAEAKFDDGLVCHRPLERSSTFGRFEKQDRSI